MIHDLGKTLEAILSDSLKREGSEHPISFARPDESFKPESQTTIDLFLFDIRENLELRSNEPVVERNNGKALIYRPPLRVVCSYLVTAWPYSAKADASVLALQEHQLLAQILQALSRYPRIPPEFLKGSLQGQEPPLPMIAARPLETKNPAEFWLAIGNKMRPSITVTATIGISLKPFEEPKFPFLTTPVGRSLVRLGERTAPDAIARRIPATDENELYRIGGRVTKGGRAEVGAIVSIDGLGLSAATDAEGHYVLGAMRAGSYILKVESEGKTTPVDIEVRAQTVANYDVQLQAAH
jgi:hypothetical protein